MGKKLIFLDIDGVLNSSLHSHFIDILEPYNKGSIEKSINQENINILKLMVEITNAEIVISSTWRKDSKIVELNSSEQDKIAVFKNIFSNYGWEEAPIVGITPNINGFRGEEVAIYLDNYIINNKLEDYIILDDDSDFILGPLSYEEDFRLDRLGVLDKTSQEAKSKFWSYQRLIIVNKLVGLSYLDLIEVLKLWEPEHDIVKEYNDYQPYISRYGKKFN